MPLLMPKDNRIPFSSSSERLLPPRFPQKFVRKTALRYSDTDLEGNQPGSHNAFFIEHHRYSNFQMTSVVSGIFTVLPGRTPWLTPGQLSWKVIEGNTSSERSSWVSGCYTASRRVSPDIISPYNLQNAHPFAEVLLDGRRGGRGKLKGEGDAPL